MKNKMWYNSQSSAERDSNGAYQTAFIIYIGEHEYNG